MNFIYYFDVLQQIFIKKFTNVIYIQGLQINIQTKMTDHIEKHILKEYQPIKKIGSGAYGHVWKVVDRRTKTIHALKKNFDAFQNSTDAQRTYREVEFLKKLKHPNIVSLQKVLQSKNQKDIYLVFDFMDIDLYTLIRENLLGEKHKRYIVYQVAKALYYLHAVDLVHRDIKPSNILVNQSCLAKVCDFGLVRTVGDQTQVNPILTEYIATRWYRAPQILLGSKKYTKAIDVWSFGCMLGEMIRGKPFFPGNSTLNQIQRVLTWTGPPFLSDIKALKTDFGKQMLDLLSKIKPINKKQWLPSCPQDALDLLTKTLEFNPQKRFTMLDILQHPYLQQFYNQQDLVVQQTKIFPEIRDEQKLTAKQYRTLLYEDINIHQQQQPLKNQSQNQKKSQNEESLEKTVYKNRVYKQVRSASKERHEPTHVIHNSVGMKNNTLLACQVYGRKNSLTVGNSMNLKKKYESMVGHGKKSDFSRSNSKNKHIKTEADHIVYTNLMPRKKIGIRKNNYLQQEKEIRQFRQQERRKKSASGYEKKRNSDVLAKYMYKNRNV